MGFRVFCVVGVVGVEVTVAEAAEEDDEVDEEGRGSGVFRETERAEEKREDKPASKIKNIEMLTIAKNYYTLYKLVKYLPPLAIYSDMSCR